MFDARVILNGVQRQIFAIAREFETSMRELGKERNMGVDPHAPEIKVAADP